MAFVCAGLVLVPVAFLYSWRLFLKVTYLSSSFRVSAYGICALWSIRMRDALRNSELTRWHQMVGARLLGPPVYCLGVHSFTAGESFGAWRFAESAFCLGLPVRSIEMDGGVLTRRCVAYKEKMLGIVMDLNRKMCLSDDCFFFLDSYQKNMDPKRQDN